MSELDEPQKFCEELLRTLEMSSKFSFKNDTEQAKYAKALSIFIDQHKELNKAYMEKGE